MAVGEIRCFSGQNITTQQTHWIPVHTVWTWHI